MTNVNLKENRFETDIEKYLITQGGYEKGSMDGYNYDFAINGKELVAFLEETQPQQWEKYKRAHSINPEHKIMQRVDQVIRQQGLVHVLRQGIKDFGANFRLFYTKPESQRNPKLQKNYEANRLKVIRQFKYSKSNNNTIDIVLMLNGIPIVAMELKDNLSGQDVNNAIIQWKEDRDSREKIFRERFFVYFAVDLKEAYMTTKLKDQETVFLPFNQGSEGAGHPGGAGNPNTGENYLTSYLWKKVLSKDMILLIIHRFLHAIDKDTLIFPRYHQLDVVNKLIKDTKLKGSGQRYLIQHSAGSGKSYSIAWLAFQLSNLHDANNEAIFNSVIVVTDRVNLDRQLQDTINSLDHTAGLVEAIGDDKSSKDLAQAIEDDKRIIITTIQKFPFITDSLSNQKNKKFAIIIDEAHQGQYGTNAQKMTQALTDKELNLEEYAELASEIEDEEIDFEDQIVQEIAAQGKHDSLSYYAFTATPKKKTLELFGTPTNKPGAQYEPFHVYSMRQAIEEGFILDVLQNYMTYDVIYQIAQSTPDDPEVPQTKAVKTIKKFASLHETNISQKTAVMAETFMDVTRKKIHGNAKAMLVTSSRKHAVRYYKAFQEYIKKHNLEKDIKVLVAFSGTVKDKGFEYEEAQMNHIKETELPQQFHDNYNLLIVAEKYQTGFDEPYLHTMFVDKRLKGVKAVQTLSRLNRICEGKNDTFVLDFANSVDEIQKAFKPFYEATMLDKGIDYNLVYDIQSKIHRRNIYRQEHIDEFMKHYRNASEDESVISEIYNKVLLPVVENYKKLSTEDMYSFRTDIRKLVKWYRYVSQIVAFNDIQLHEECIFLSYLDRILPTSGDTSQIDLNGKLALQYFKLRKSFEGSASIDDEYEKDEGILINPDQLKEFTYTDEEEVRLSIVIEAINKNFEGELTEEDINIISELTRQATNNNALREDATSNDQTIYMESFFPRFFKDAIAQGYQKKNDAYEKIFKDQEYSQAMMKAIAEITYREFNDLLSLYTK